MPRTVATSPNPKRSPQPGDSVSRAGCIASPVVSLIESGGGGVVGICIPIGWRAVFPVFDSRDVSLAKKSKTPEVSLGGFEKAGDNLLSRYSHYHGPQVLNGRVRNGNGCGHLGMVTGKKHSGQWAVSSGQ